MKIPALIKHDAARRALAEAVRVDEVKSIRDKAMAMRVYAQQAKDITLISHATEIRMRAERRAGELLAEMEKNKGERSQSHPKTGGSMKRPPVDATPKLSDLGVSKTQSSRWQKLAAIPEGDFEDRVGSAAQHAVASIERSARKPPVKKKSKTPPRAIGPIDRCTADVRAIVLEIMREMPPSEWPTLLAALRDELDDIEKVAERRQQDGHNASRQSA